MIWIVFAAVFLVALFLLKNGLLVLKNPFNFGQGNQKNGLAYSSATVGDLVNKDTDGDGIPDWEEGLYGLDPTKKETTPGIPDSVAIEKLKAQAAGASGLVNSGNQGTENLTQTDKFSRELFATVASLSQNGQMDQATQDQVGNSLANSIQNTPPRKIFLLADVKIIKDDSVGAVQKYNLFLSDIYQKNPTKYTILDALQKFSADANNPDISALSLLDSNIKQINGFIDGMVKMSVPQSLTTLHLNVLNGFERIVENLNDIKLYGADTVVALGGITKYNQNATVLVSDMTKLTDAIIQKLKK